MNEVWLATAVFTGLAYLIGSVPFGLLLAQAFMGTDLRQIGSGNIGATNVLRTGSKTLALATVLLDGTKAALPLLILHQIKIAGLPTEPWWPGLLALGVCMGHCYPIWLKFKGGKAVASFLGVWIALLPWAGLTLGLVWLVVAVIWRRSSLAALSASFSAPFLVIDQPILFGFMIALSVLIWWRHHANFARLLNDTEPKIGPPS